VEVIRITKNFTQEDPDTRKYKLRLGKGPLVEG